MKLMERDGPVPLFEKNSKGEITHIKTVHRYFFKDSVGNIIEESIDSHLSPGPIGSNIYGLYLKTDHKEILFSGYKSNTDLTNFYKIGFYDLFFFVINQNLIVLSTLIFALASIFFSSQRMHILSLISIGCMLLITITIYINMIYINLKFRKIVSDIDFNSYRS